MNHSLAAQPRTWLVTGCSSGLGRALCERLLERGTRVVCTARNVSALADLKNNYPDRAIVLPLDVCDPTAIQKAVNTALERTGGIDVVVNNAGYGLVGALEEVDEQAIKAFAGNGEMLAQHLGQGAVFGRIAGFGAVASWRLPATQTGPAVE